MNGVKGANKSSKTIDIVSYAFLESECKWYVLY